MLFWHRWGSTGLQQLLHQIEFNACFCLVLNNREIAQLIIMPNVAGERVTMLVC